MSKFYGQVFGQAETSASRRGSREIKVSAQSWDGSVQTRLWYDETGALMVGIDIAKGESSAFGRSIFRGTLDELERKLGKEPK